MHQVQFTRAFWDDWYGARTQVWSGNPNAQLVHEVAGLPPGRALDAGCGEGGDAHWLAAHGWRVTALDVSPVALERGSAHADPEFADRITWRQADLTAWAPRPDDRYDLVSAQYAQFPSAPRTVLFGQLADAVRPGGALVIVGHHPADMRAGQGEHHDPDMFFTAEQVADTLEPAEWKILVAAARPRTVVGPDGRDITISDAVLHARRSG